MEVTGRLLGSQKYLLGFFFILTLTQFVFLFNRSFQTHPLLQCPKLQESGSNFTHYLFNNHLPMGERIAVVVAGEIRTWDNVVQNFKKNIVDALGKDLVDVYFHTSKTSWREDGGVKTLADVHELEDKLHRTAPNLISVAVAEAPSMSGYVRQGGGNVISNTQYPQFFRFQQALWLILDRENQIKQRYRMVLRTRPDLQLDRPLLPAANYTDKFYFIKIQGEDIFVDTFYFVPRYAIPQLFLQGPGFWTKNWESQYFEKFCGDVSDLWKASAECGITFAVRSMFGEDSWQTFPSRPKISLIRHKEVS